MIEVIRQLLTTIVLVIAEFFIMIWETIFKWINRDA